MLQAHHNGVYHMVLKKARCENANAARNQTAMLSHILRSTEWTEKLQKELRLESGASWDDLVRGMEAIYGITLKRQASEDEDTAPVMEQWRRSFPVVWDILSL